MKHKQLKLVWGLLLLPLLVFSGCLKEGKDTAVLPFPNGKIPYDVIPERLQDSLTSHGFEINEGVTPPTISGTFLISPMTLEYASDNYINNFYDMEMTFTGQHPRGRISYSEVQNNVPGQSIEANIIGSNDKFSMYNIQYVTKTNDRGDTSWWCKIATVVSGSVCDSGIANCQYSYVLLDKWYKNEYYGLLLPPTETFRFWKDGDNMTDKLSK